MDGFLYRTVDLGFSPHSLRQPTPSQKHCQVTPSSPSSPFASSPFLEPRSAPSPPPHSDPQQLPNRAPDSQMKYGALRRGRRRWCGRDGESSLALVVGWRLRLGRGREWTRWDERWGCMRELGEEVEEQVVARRTYFRFSYASSSRTSHSRTHPRHYSTPLVR